MHSLFGIEWLLNRVPSGTSFQVIFELMCLAKIKNASSTAAPVYSHHRRDSRLAAREVARALNPAPTTAKQLSVQWKVGALIQQIRLHHYRSEPSTVATSDEAMFKE